jgi:hypothetical protein
VAVTAWRRTERFAVTQLNPADDHGNTPLTATDWPVQTRPKAAGVFESQPDVDVFAFTAPASGAYVFTTESSPGGMALMSLEDDAGNVLGVEPVGVLPLALELREGGRYSLALSCRRDVGRVSYTVSVVLPRQPSATPGAPTVSDLPDSIGLAGPAWADRGHASVGETLMAGDLGLAGSPGVAISYQWHRDGKRIAGQTGVGFKLTAADAGAKIRLAVTVRLPGGASKVIWSQAVSVAKIFPRVKLKLSKTSAAASAKLTAKVTVVARGVKAPKGQVVVKVGAKRLVKKLTVAKKGKITFKLPRLARGKHQVRAYFKGSAQIAAGSKKAVLRITR